MYRRLARLLCCSWAVDDVPAGDYNSLKLRQFFFEVPAERMRRDHYVGKAIRQRDGMAETVDDANIVLPFAGRLIADELSEPCDRFDGDHCMGHTGRLQGHPTGSGADVNDHPTVERRNARNLGEVPVVKLQAIVDLGTLVVYDQVGDGPYDYVFCTKEITRVSGRPIPYFHCVQES